MDMSTNFYHEPPRSVPVVADVDVLVAGGGPAGVGAALAAARTGAKTMVVERFNNLGGMATAGMMSHWSGARSLPLLDEIMAETRKMASLPLEFNEIDPFTRDRGCSHEAIKTALLRMMAASHVQVQLNTLVVGAMMEGNRVAGVVTESKSGREAIRAKVVVDATGDGDVAAFAGAEYLQGREGDRQCQPVTEMFRIAGVDYARAIFPPGFESLVNVPLGEIQAFGKANLPFPAGHVLLYRCWIPGEVCVNMTNVIDIDGTDVRDLTKAEFVCREQIEAIVPFLRKYAPGYERCYLVAAAENVGVRETRHFKGVYTLTAEDVVEARVFDDWISTRNFFNFDIHSIVGPGLDKNGAQKHFRSKGVYTIPYRACVPAATDGLLLSGRNISGTHKAPSNYRVMGICMSIGQGVGVAAALAAKHGVAPRDVDVSELQGILRARGVEP